jgi:hypothetical protein
MILKSVLKTASDSGLLLQTLCHRQILKQNYGFGTQTPEFMTDVGQILTVP